jgi:hypothetical protein
MLPRIFFESPTVCDSVRHARLAQSVERETLNLNVVGSSPTLGVFLFSFSFVAFVTGWWQGHSNRLLVRAAAFAAMSIAFSHRVRSVIGV